MTIDPDGVITDNIERDYEYGQVKPPFFRTAFNYNKEAASLQSGLHCTDETRTQQQFAEECDINTIVRKFGLTGQLPQGLHVPVNADFDEIIDYQTALNMIMEADDAFMQMPAHVRERFNHDAGKFVEFASDPANKEECQRLGIGKAPEPLRAPIEVRVIGDPSEVEKSA